MARVAEASRTTAIDGVRIGHRPVAALVFMILAEFRRARAAEQRYDDLKHNGATFARHGTDGGVPRRVFQEFYSGRIGE